MSQIDFHEIKKLAERTDNPFGKELVEDLKGLVLVRHYFEKEAKSLSHTYSTRYKINQEVTHFEGIKGWLPLIPNLKELAEEGNSRVRVISFTTENNHYLHFTSVDMNQLYGVLQFTEEKINRNTELTSNGELKGTWTDSVFYDNGVVVKNGS